MRRQVASWGLTLAVTLVAIPAPVTAQTAGEAGAPPRTAWGAPDLGGLWDFRSLIPLERPSEFEGRDTLTEEEATVFAQRTIESRNGDNRSGNAAADFERAYSDVWWDWESDLAGDRTSLITDPPDGRIPAPVPDAVRLDGTRPFAERPVCTPYVARVLPHEERGLGAEHAVSAQCVDRYGLGAAAVLLRDGVGQRNGGDRGM